MSREMRTIRKLLLVFCISLFALSSYGAPDSNRNSRQLRQSDSLPEVNVSTSTQLREAVENLQSGLSLYINASSIRLTQSITIDEDNVTIKGRESTQTVVHCPGETQSAVIIRGHGIRIEDLTFFGCLNESAVVIDGRNETGRTEISASFANVAFSQNGRINGSVTGAGLRIDACVSSACTRPKVSVTRCIFRNNTAIAGGAISGVNCDLQISNSTFFDNKAIFAGGAIYLNGGRPLLEIQSSNFTRNRTTNNFNVVADSMYQETQRFSVLSGRGGGAVFITSPIRLNMNSSHLEENSASVLGGAVYIRSKNNNKTLITTVELSLHKCNFTRNTILDIESLTAAQNDSFGPLSKSGGALTSIVSQNVLLEAQITRSTFIENISLNGGAVFLEGSSSVSHSFKLCNFTRNRATAAGGAVMVRGTQVEINGSTFQCNAGRYGGALLIWNDAQLVARRDQDTLERTVFQNNAALYSGAIEASLRVRVELEGVIFRNNSSLRHGGGLRVYETTRPVVIRGGVFEDNFAMLGGGISLMGVSNFTLESFHDERVQILRNTAFVGGGVYCAPGVFLFLMITLKDADFVENTVYDLKNQAVGEVYSTRSRDPVLLEILQVLDDRFPWDRIVEEVYPQMTSLPDGQGGGFAMTVGDLTRYVVTEIVFDNIRLDGNSAYVGGGGSLHVFESNWNNHTRIHCFPAVLGVDSCQKLIFQNVTIVDNEAEYAGGLFVSTPEAVMITCNRNVVEEKTTLLKVMNTRFQAPNRSVDVKNNLLCTNIHSNTLSNGSSTEGADVGSAAASLHLEKSDGVLKTVASGERLSLPCEDGEDEPCSRNLTVVVKDAFNQTIRSGTKDARLELTLSSSNVAGTLRYTTSNGAINITNTTTYGVNVTSAELVISSNANGVQPVNITFSTRACVLGEIVQESSCNLCPPNQYGFTPANSSCQPCEDDAICQGKAALVPKDGFWHSTPFSPQFHSCFFPKACTYENRAQLLTRFYDDVERLQSLLYGVDNHIAGGATMSNFSAYKQCADGYEGVLCGSCAANYGHSLSGECARCPAHRTVSTFLGAAFFLWIFTVVGINAAMTLFSSRDRIRLVKSKLRSVTGERTAVLRRTTAHINRDAVREVTEQTRSISGPSSDMTDLHSRQLLQERLVATVQLTELLKILLNYLQITSAALRLHMEWDTQMRVLLSTEAAFVGVASDGLTAPFECLFDNSSLKHPSIAAIWLRMLIPTIALFALVLVFSIVWLSIQWRHRKDRSIKKDNIPVEKSWKTGMIVIVIVAVSFSFIDVIRDLFRTINCVHVDKSVSSDSGNPYNRYAMETEGAVWVEDTDIKCFKGAHKGTGIAGIFGLLLAFIVILSIIIRLPLHRRNMKNPKFIARYWFLYQGYRMEWFTFGWEAVILTRKALIAAIIVFAVHIGPNLQSTLCVGVLLVALMIHSICRPFIVEKEGSNVPDYFGVFFECIRLPSFAPKWREFTNSTNLNGMESASLICSMSVFLSAAIIHHSRASRSGTILIETATFLVNLLYLMFMFYRLYAGLHLVCDLKLELSDPAYMALNPNGPGLCCLLKKGRRVLRLTFEEHEARRSGDHDNQIELSVHCTAEETRNETSDSEMNFKT